MKRTITFAVAIVALSLAGQAFAKGGSMGGATMSSTLPHQMSTMTHNAVNAGSMQHGAMQGTMAPAGSQGTMTGKTMQTASGTMQGSTSKTAQKAGMPTSAATSNNK